MEKIKAYTDLEQSKKLAEILPLESADMYWWSSGKRYYIESIDDGDFNEREGHVRAWSLAALLDILPNGIVMNKDSQNGRYHFSSKYVRTYVTADNPIDACVAMIEKLHELNLLCYGTNR